MKNLKLNLKGLCGYRQSLLPRSPQPRDNREMSERRPSEERTLLAPLPQRFARYAAMLIMLLTLGVGQMWGYTVYLYTGSFTDWESGADFQIWDGSNNHDMTSLGNHWYSTTLTGSPSAWIKRVKSSNHGEEWNSFSASITSSKNVWYVSGWNSGGELKYYIKHPWDGGSWTWQTMTFNSANTFKYTGIYKSSNGANVNQDKGDSNYLTPSNASNVNDKVPAIWTYTPSSNSLRIDPAYTLTVNNDGHGSASGSVSKGIKMSTKYAISASSPSTGYHFNNWTRVSGGTCTFDNASSASTNVTVSGDASATVQANFALNTYTVAYDANDDEYPGTASGSTTSSSHTYDTAKKLTSNGFSRAGYTFAGWATTPTGSVAYTNGQSVTNLTSTHEATVTLYAKWTENKSNITLVASPSGKGTFQVGGETVTSTQAGVTTTPSVTAYPISGYRFTGWSITGGASISSTSDNPTTITGGGAGTAATLTATFEENLVYYDVTFGVGTSYTSLGSLSATNNTTSSAISSGDDILSASNITFTATPNTGYEVAGFYSDASCETLLQSGNTTTYTIASLSSAVTVYVKFVEKTWSVAFAAGTGGTVTTPAATPQTVGQVTGISIAATPATGYTFNTWTITSGSGSFTSAATTNSNTFKPTAASTITASFNETKSTITVTTATSSQGTLKFGGTSKSWGATASLGVATTQSITATAAAGFRFVRWDLTGAAASASSLTSATITLKADGSGSTGTATAVFEEDLSSPWIVAGGNKIVTTGTTWRTTADEYNSMLKKTGHSTESVVYFTVPVTTVCSGDPNTNFQFKIYNTSTSKWYGLFASGSYYLLKAEDGTEKSLVEDNQNIELRAYVTGDYVLKLDYSTSTPKLTVTWPVYNQVRISAASPSDAGNVGNYDLSEPVSNVRTVTRSLKANTTYTFKIMYNSDWYGYNSGTFTRSTSTSSNSRTLSISGGNLTLTTDYAGDYTFRFNQSTKALSVDFPTAYKVTYGKGTVDGSTGSCSAKDIDNGNAAVTSNSTWVKSGNRVVLTAPVAKTGYTYNGWFDNNSGTGAAITTNANCTITVSSALTRYACYTINNYAITHSASSHGSYTIQVGSAAAVSTSTTSDYGKTITLAATPATGYHFGSWSAYKTGTPATTVTVTSNQFTMPDYAVTVGATFSPTTYSITYHTNGGSAISAGSYNIETATFALPTTSEKTGYTFAGWYTNAELTGDPVASIAVGSYGNKEYWAKWTANPYTITLTQSGETGYGSAGTASVTATYDAALPTISSLPTAANGYAFMGYYTGHNGTGTQYYGADGTKLVATYTTADALELFAYFKKAEITNLVASPGVIAPGETITITPTIDPTPVEPTIVCWEVQYSNGTPLPSQPTFTPGEGNDVSFPVPSASATYIIQAKLAKGSDCPADPEDVLSTRTTTFQVAGEHTVTIRYQDSDGRTLQASASIEASPLNWTTDGDITPPTITGYTFARWDAGDGVTIKNGVSDPVTTTTTPSIQIKAVYDGTLTAVYNKKRMIFFNNTLGWSNVYVYFYKNDSYWDKNNGTGANTSDTYTDTPYSEGLHGEMTQIEGTNIFYFDAEAAGVNASYINVAFTELDQHGYHYFAKTDDVKNKVIRRGDYSTTLPMFVPLEGIDPTEMNGKLADYYNEGYWMNYPENTGYTLHIYDSKTYGSGSSMQVIPFEFNGDKTMPMTVKVELNANREYGYEIHRADGNVYGNDSKVLKINDSGEEDPEGLTKDQRGGIQTSVAGDYEFKLDFGNNGGYHYLIGVHYPVAANDYRIVYTDQTAWSKAAHTSGWYHPSRAIHKEEGSKDIVSFYVSKAGGANASMKFQYASSINASTGAVTWMDVPSGSINLSGITESGVYNFHLSQDAGSISVEKIEPYTGNYYIRTDCAGNSKWENFRTSDHQMTYSDYAEVNSDYSHYYTHWVTSGTNVKFTIANDYSQCISDTLAEDYGTVIADITAEGNDGAGRLNSASANIRFMWDQSTNKVSRAYIGGSTYISDRFLVLEGDSKMYDQDGSPLSISGLNPNEANLIDVQNFVYERTIQVNTKARAKLTAKYNNNIQYFKGSEGTFADGTTIELLGGDAIGKHTMRIVYDFKTNRLVTAYVPSGTINADIAINADLMIVREHQGAGQQLLFEGAGKLSKVHTVYGVMRFNRWTLNNKEKTGAHSPVGDPKSIYERSLYWISFPFNVNLSDVFGFGTYGVDWIIEYYDGAERAANGYWIDSDGFWKMVMPAQRANFTLEAGKGYVLAIDIDAMKDNNTTFWANNIEQVELFFPSAANVENITQTTAHTIVPAHECTIDRRTDKSVYDTNKDRTKADSHWNMIGVPSYANYNKELTDGSSTITWHDPETEDLPFLYEWNMTDDSYTVQSVSTYLFKAMHAYMVQYHGDLYWSLASATPTPSPIVARRAYAEKPQNAEFRLELQQNEKMVDHTFVNMKDAEEISAGFKFDEDLCKEFNAGKANIYTLIENYLPAAGNTLPMSEQTTLVLVGVKTTAAGEYTFAMPEGTNGVSVVLIDNIAGTRTNLALSDYTVALGKGDLSDRFMLEIAPIKQMPTGIDAVSDQHSAVRKVMIDGILYIVKDGKVFDARGAKVK